MRGVAFLAICAVGGMAWARSDWETYALCIAILVYGWPRKVR